MRMAISCEPKLLIADEPTTALDVTIQKQVLELLFKLQQEYHMSMMFITHDLGVIGDIADDVVVNIPYISIRRTILPPDPDTRKGTRG